MIEQELITLLEADPVITGALSGGVVPFFRLASEDLPAIVYESGPEDRETYIDGTQSNIAKRVITLHCWAHDYEVAKQIAEDARRVILAANNTPGGPFNYVKAETGADLFDEEGETFLTPLQITVFYG